MNEVQDVVRTLLLSGFEIQNVRRNKNYASIATQRRDEFHALSRHLFAIADDNFGLADIGALEQLAHGSAASLVLISSSFDSSISSSSLTIDQFFGKLGGSIRNFLPFENYYSAHLRTLGFNEVPVELKGQGPASDLFEEYVKQGLEFIFQQKVVRCGKKRSGKELPDGFVLGDIILPYDCKAAKKYFDFDAPTMRQFDTYVKEFRQRYRHYGLDPYGFLVISGSFKDKETIISRSDDLYSRCRLKLIALDVQNLDEIVRIFTAEPRYRQVLDWTDLLAKPLLTADAVRRNVEERKKDDVLMS